MKQQKNTNASPLTVTSSITMSHDLRLRIEAVRIARARRDGCLGPGFSQLVVEAIELLVQHEEQSRQ